MSFSDRPGSSAVRRNMLSSSLKSTAGVVKANSDPVGHDGSGSNIRRKDGNPKPRQNRSNIRSISWRKAWNGSIGAGRVSIGRPGVVAAWSRFTSIFVSAIVTSDVLKDAGGARFALKPDAQHLRRRP